MAKTNFAHALGEVLKHEGGYVDHPSDPGGATNLGVTIGTLSRWLGRPATKAEVKALTVKDVTPIYRKNYWSRVRGDDLPAGLDLALFDFAVNSGPDRAIRALQAIVGVTVDGVIGPVTLTAISKRPASQIINELCARRLAFLQRLSTFATFGKGWSRRVEAVRTAALSMAQSTPVQPDKPPTPNWLSALLAAIAAFFMRNRKA